MNKGDSHAINVNEKRKEGRVSSGSYQPSNLAMVSIKDNCQDYDHFKLTINPILSLSSNLSS